MSEAIRPWATISLRSCPQSLPVHQRSQHGRHIRWRRQPPNAPLPGERRAARREIDELARTITAEGQRAQRIYRKLKIHQDAAFSLEGAYGGSAHRETQHDLDEKLKHIAGIEALCAKMAAVPAGDDLTQDDLVDRLPNLRAALVEVRGLLEDGIAELEQIVACNDAIIVKKIGMLNAR